jgi:GT2 family glycosyltransferase
MKMSKKRVQTHQSTYRPLVSVVIPSYLRYDLLQRCLDSLPAAFGGVPYEVVLMENGSPQEEREKFYSTAALPPHTTTVMLHKNLGFPEVCNRGASRASGALLFFLNNDVILDPGAGETLVCNMDDPTVGVAGMKLVFPTDAELNDADLKHSDVQRAPECIQHVGLYMNLHGQVIHMYLGWSADNPRVESAPYSVFAVTGAALMIRRRLFFDVGSFDLAYGKGTYEDVDLCMKVKETGKRVVIDTKARGKHFTGATAEKYNLGFPLNENQMLFNQRWYNKLVWNEWEAW